MNENESETTQTNETPTPIPTFESKVPLTEEEQAATPEFQEVKKEVERNVAADQIREDREAVKRLLDNPVPFEIGGETYHYTSRPMGYLDLIKDEILGLQDFFKQVQQMISADVEVKGDEPPDPNAPPISEEDIEEIFISRGSEGIDAMVRIGQLLVEPIHDPPRAPDRNDMKLKFETAKWGMTSRQFAQMISIFYLRDLGATGAQIQNLMRLGQTAP